MRACVRALAWISACVCVRWCARAWTCFWARVALLIQRATRIGRTAVCGPLALPYFWHYHINDKIFGKIVIGHKMCVFSCTNFIWNIYHFMNNSARYLNNSKVQLTCTLITRWFKYDRDYFCVNKSQFVPVIFEPPCIFTPKRFGLKEYHLQGVFIVEWTSSTWFRPKRVNKQVHVSWNVVLFTYSSCREKTNVRISEKLS